MNRPLFTLPLLVAVAACHRPTSGKVVWRDAAGKVVPAVDDVTLTAFDLGQVDRVRYVDASTGLVWSIDPVSGDVTPAETIEAVYTTTDCSGPAYARALPRLVYSITSQATHVHFPDSARQTTVTIESRMTAWNGCKGINPDRTASWTGAVFAVADAIPLSRSDVPHAFVAPLHPEVEK